MRADTKKAYDKQLKEINKTFDERLEELAESYDERLEDMRESTQEQIDDIRERMAELPTTLLSCLRLSRRSSVCLPATRRRQEPSEP